jgi:hypothetical protein
VAGVHARVGAGYELPVFSGVPDAAPDTAHMTVTEDAADLTEVSYAAPGVDAVVRAVDPSLPGALHLGLRGEHGELSVLGREYTTTASLHAAAIDRDGDLGVGEVRLKRLVVIARATTHHRGDRVRVRISPRGCLRPAAPAFCFLRRKMEREAQPRLDEAVAHLSTAVSTGNLDRAVREPLLFRTR